MQIWGGIQVLHFSSYDLDQVTYFFWLFGKIKAKEWQFWWVIERITFNIWMCLAREWHVENA